MDIVDISKDNYEMLLVSHQIELAIIIEENFLDEVLNLKDLKITIKAISNSYVN